MDSACELIVIAAWETLGTLMNGGTLCIRTSNWNDTLSKVVVNTLKLYSVAKTTTIGGHDHCDSNYTRNAERRRFLKLEDHCFGGRALSIEVLPSNAEIVCFDDANF